MNKQWSGMEKKYPKRIRIDFIGYISAYIDKLSV